MFISKNVEKFKEEKQLFLNHIVLSINPYVFAENTYQRNNKFSGS
jgi:hypothetical protein